MDYNPPNALIKKVALVPFIASIENANTLVTTTEQALGTARGARNPLVFKIKDTNPACLENRMRGAANFTSSETASAAFVTATKKIRSILKKIRPHYAKKAEGAPRGAGKSPSEKSFESAVGHGRALITILTGLGPAYAPADPNLSVASLIALVNLIEAENQNVQTALDNYGTANRARKKLYQGPEGLEKRRSGILKYLSSFPGLKKSNYYIEYSQAIKGT